MSEPIAAATILIVRDAPGAGLEVLMIERHHAMDFASGALVFPGGKASKEDSDAGWTPLVDAAASGPGQALRIAAVREAFEESGLALARPASRRGPGAALASAQEIAALSPMREAVINAGGFLRAVARAELVLALDALAPFAHWITPEGAPKRFDTHFFIAAAPAAQSALCDGAEAVEACWIAPQAALQAAAEGRRRVMFPTRMNLELLSRSASARDAMATARTRRIAPVTPRIVRESGAVWLTIPADAGYATTRSLLDLDKD